MQNTMRANMLHLKTNLHVKTRVSVKNKHLKLTHDVLERTHSRRKQCSDTHVSMTRVHMNEELPSECIPKRARLGVASTSGAHPGLAEVEDAEHRRGSW